MYPGSLGVFTNDTDTMPDSEWLGDHQQLAELDILG
jgi:hypothetical protein